MGKALESGSPVNSVRMADWIGGKVTQTVITQEVADSYTADSQVLFVSARQTTPCVALVLAR